MKKQPDHEVWRERLADLIAESVTATTDEEIEEVIRAEGEDPEEAAERVREVLLEAVEKYRDQQRAERSSGNRDR